MLQHAGMVLGQLQSAEAWHKSVLAALLIRRVRTAQVRVRVRACVCMRVCKPGQQFTHLSACECR